MARDLFTNQASTTVAASKTAPAAGTTESWTVASSSSFPSASNSANPVTEFYVSDPAAPTELILVTNVSGTTWSVTRGADGTTPVTHSAGFTIKNVIPAKWLQRLEDRLKSEEFNVKDFGALGDDSNDDWGGIQGALNAARDNDGGTVYIPKGEYRLYTIPLKVYQGTHIVCDPEAHIMAYANTSSMVWNGTGGDSPTGYEGNGNIVVDGGIWDNRGGVFEEGAACFSFAHGRNLTWRNVTIMDIADTHAIEVNGCQNVRVLNCTFAGFYANTGREYSEAVQLDMMKSSDVYGAFGAYDGTPCDDVLVDGCRFTVSGSANTHKWGRGVGSHNGTIGIWHTNVRVVNNYFNVNHEAVRGYSWNRTVVANNILDQCGSGIELRSIPYGGTGSADTEDINGVQQNTSQDFEDFVIADNLSYGGDSTQTNIPKIYIIGETTGQAHNGNISGNMFKDCGAVGIRATYINDSTINGNMIDGTGVYTTSPAAYGIEMNPAYHCHIVNNRVANTNNHAIVLFGQGDHNTVKNNYIYLAGQRAIYVSGDDHAVIDGNYIYGVSNLNASGTDAMLSDGTTVPVTWSNNVIRQGGAHNYTYALRTSNGTHYVYNIDAEPGSTNTFNLSGTILGGDPVSLPCVTSSLTAAGTKGTNVNEIIAPADGIIVSMQARLSAVSGSPTFRPAINGTGTGTTSAAQTTSVVTTGQNLSFNKGDRIGVNQVGTATSASNLLVTYSVIFNKSDL